MRGAFFSVAVFCLLVFFLIIPCFLGTLDPLLCVPPIYWQFSFYCSLKKRNPFNNEEFWTGPGYFNYTPQPCVYFYWINSIYSLCVALKLFSIRIWSCQLSLTLFCLQGKANQQIVNPPAPQYIYMQFHAYLISQGFQICDRFVNIWRKPLDQTIFPVQIKR